MPAKTRVQASIIDQLDRAIAIIVHNGHKPTSIYLDAADRKRLDQHETRIYRAATGSKAFLWPCSYKDIPLITEKLIQHYEIPVRQDWNGRCRHSVVYGSNGVGIPLDAV